jgi:hypothetical protein
MPGPARRQFDQYLRFVKWSEDVTVAAAMHDDAT